MGLFAEFPTYIPIFLPRKKSVLIKTVKISIFLQVFWTFNDQARTAAQQFLPACRVSALQILMTNALLK